MRLVHLQGSAKLQLGHIQITDLNKSNLGKESDLYNKSDNVSNKYDPDHADQIESKFLSPPTPVQPTGSPTNVSMSHDPCTTNASDPTNSVSKNHDPGTADQLNSPTRKG